MLCAVPLARGLVCGCNASAAAPACACASLHDLFPADMWHCLLCFASQPLSLFSGLSCLGCCVLAASVPCESLSSTWRASLSRWAPNAENDATHCCTLSPRSSSCLLHQPTQHICVLCARKAPPPACKGLCSAAHSTGPTSGWGDACAVGTLIVPPIPFV